eukprot:TRINITY_DN81952_c0_g1_i1.p1 TRINITY_DN81952_c0_g1~~TRINITY_DN81952_c0_g1_i1.p1  ORF type:complete len:232 (+),score=36.81 TRINITY_DN81952_c0_g1_i1:50-745(+)
MCWNWQVSLATSAIGFLSTYLKAKREEGSRYAVFWSLVSVMQLWEMAIHLWGDCEVEWLTLLFHALIVGTLLVQPLAYAYFLEEKHPGVGKVLAAQTAFVIIVRAANFWVGATRGVKTPVPGLRHTDASYCIAPGPLGHLAWTFTETTEAPFVPFHIFYPLLAILPSVIFQFRLAVVGGVCFGLVALYAWESPSEWGSFWCWAIHLECLVEYLFYRRGPRRKSLTASEKRQ